MEQNLFTCKAWLWNGQEQLAGQFLVNNKTVVFQPDSFATGNLNITIRFQEIKNVKTFMLFDLSRNGFSINCNSGSKDNFVLDNSAEVKKLLDGLLMRQVT